MESQVIKQACLQGLSLEARKDDTVIVIGQLLFGESVRILILDV